MIESLSQADIERIKARSSLPVVQKAFAFFKSRGISDSGLAARLKEEFQPSRCLSANNESEIEKKSNPSKHPGGQRQSYKGCFLCAKAERGLGCPKPV